MYPVAVTKEVMASTCLVLREVNPVSLAATSEAMRKTSQGCRKQNLIGQAKSACTMIRLDVIYSYVPAQC